MMEKISFDQDGNFGGGSELMIDVCWLKRIWYAQKWAYPLGSLDSSSANECGGNWAVLDREISGLKSNCQVICVLIVGMW